MRPFTVLIPARYASTRLPGKPLADIAGKPMIVRVAERAAASGARRVVVATDDERIASAVAAHGHEAIVTRSDHPTGTDRLAEAAFHQHAVPAGHQLAYAGRRHAGAAFLVLALLRDSDVHGLLRVRFAQGRARRVAAA